MIIPDNSCFFALAKNEAETEYSVQKMEFKAEAKVSVVDGTEMRRLAKKSAVRFRMWVMVRGCQQFEFFTKEGKLDREYRNDLYLAAMWQDCKTEEIYLYVPSCVAEMNGEFGRRMGTGSVMTEGVNLSPYTERAKNKKEGK